MAGVVFHRKVPRTSVPYSDAPQRTPAGSQDAGRRPEPLIEADDGGFYVVKFSNNPQHRRVLINECIGGSFLAYLQISAPRTALISVGPEFLRENPEVSIQLGSRTVPVEPGWHFGSRYPEHPTSWRSTTISPTPAEPGGEPAAVPGHAGVRQVDGQRRRPPGDLLPQPGHRVDRWRRQRPPAFLAWMIDQGFLFNGPHWDFRIPVQGLYHAPGLPVGRLAGRFPALVDWCCHFPPEVVDEAYRQVPLQWMEPGEDALKSCWKAARTSRRVAT